MPSGVPTITRLPTRARISLTHWSMSVSTRGRDIADSCVTPRSLWERVGNRRSRFDYRVCKLPGNRSWVVCARRRRIHVGLEQTPDAPVFVQPGVRRLEIVVLRRIDHHVEVRIAQLLELLDHVHAIEEKHVVVFHALQEQ